MNTLFEKAFDMTGKLVLITGGGTGLGFAMARCFVAAGARVVITGRRGDVLREACAELGENAYPRVFDVTQTAQAKDFIRTLEAELGPVDVLVNNAGRHCKKPMLDVTQEDLRGVLDVHLMGAYALTQAVLPQMLARKTGNILFISSMSAYLGMTQVTAYSAAKSAVLGLVKTISGEVAAHGVRVNAIAPGFIDTPMFRQATSADLPRQQKILGHTPMERYGDPMDVGWAAVYLSSPAASFITGVCMPVDGGCSIGF